MSAGSGTIRAAVPSDCGAVAAIYNEAIDDGQSTLETRARAASDVEPWLDAPGRKLLVADADGAIAGWARLSPYSPRPCYAGVAEAAVYVRTAARRNGLGGALARGLQQWAHQTGHHKVVGKLLLQNEASRRLAARHGFREVGVHLRHGQLRGVWHDVLVVELLLGSAAD